MDYSNIFTTYNSVDPPVWREKEETIEEFPKVENPLYGLLDRFQSNLETTSKEEKDDTSFLDQYEFLNPKESKEESGSKQSSKLFKNQKDFIAQMKPIYEKVLKEQGIDSSYADYLVAQSALESGWGKHQAGKFNLGGIKLPSRQKGRGLGTVRKTREVINGKETYIEDEFRNFKDLEDYARFHVGLLSNMNYQAFKGDFISNVVRGGYATDPKYKQILQNVYNKIKTNYG